MKLSTKGRYGTRAALELALHYGAGPVLVRDISKSQDISERYLENILNALRKSGIVTSSRGARGGYQLNRDPAEITIGDVIRAVEGPLDVVDCTGKSECERMCTCSTNEVWRRLKEVIERELDSISLRDLADRDRILRAKQSADYII